MRTSLGVTVLIVASCLCYGAATLASGRGSGVLCLAWFTALTVAGFLSGLAWPRCAVWGAIVITLSQSIFVYWQLQAAGEIANPSRSTGGMVDWAMDTVFLAAFSPVPAAASWLGSRLRTRLAPDQRARAGRMSSSNHEG